MKPRVVLVALIAAAAVAAALAPPGSATNECQGLQTCIRVVGPWVVVPAGQTVRYLLACPGGKSVVAGLDAQATTRDVRVGFEGRLGAPVGPGVTTTRYAVFRATSVSSQRQAFQPRLGCVPAAGGGGRSTVSARVTPAGPSLEYRSRIVVVGPGALRFARVGCFPEEKLVGSWTAVAFRTAKPPPLRNAALIRATSAIASRKVVVTASATDRLSIDVHAIVQVGAECAP